MRSQRGLSTSVQAALILPAMFALMLLALQWALHSWASATALAAAQEGARAVAVHEATASDGIAEASRLVNSRALASASVSGSRSATEASVTVRGTALSLVPGWAPIVTKTVTIPVERPTR